MSNTDKFVWTDELALEFLNFRIKYAAGFPHETVLKHFKQSKEQVEEKRIEVKKFCLQSSSDKESWYEFLIKGYITEDKYEAVKQAIENVLTDIPQYYCGIRPEQLTIETIKRDYKPPVVVVNGERYIEEQKDAIPPTPEPQDSKEEPKPLFEEAIRKIINSYSLENESDTPDYILAQYLANCLTAYTKAVQSRSRHIGSQTN